MLRIGELVLVAAPLLAIVILYFVGFRGRFISQRTLALAALAVMGFGAWLAWLGTSEGLDRATRYVPAVLDNGAVVDGHGARR